MSDVLVRADVDESVSLFRNEVRKFFAREVIPFIDQWEAAGVTPRSFWRRCGEAGILCPTVPEIYGGLGLDFRFNAVVQEELAYAYVPMGLTVHSDIVPSYLIHYGSEAQKRRWLPAMVSGEAVAAIAMTEPAAGSDLQAMRATAIREGSDYVVNGSKTYITNGKNADFVIVAVKTRPDAGAKGVSLIIIEGDRPGFERGRNLAKIGQHSADTSELFFNDVRVPTENLLGEENRGFTYLMTQLPEERLSIAISAQACAQKAFDVAVAFTKHRPAFGKRVFDFQNTRFTLGDFASKLQVGWAHVDWAMARYIAGLLTAAEASAAKLWHTELQWEIVDQALQLHGGAGYMEDYEIARLWRDARVARIYGGTSEIMKELISRSV